MVAPQLFFTGAQTAQRRFTSAAKSNKKLKLPRLQRWRRLQARSAVAECAKLLPLLNPPATRKSPMSMAAATTRLRRCRHRVARSHATSRILSLPPPTTTTHCRLCLHCRRRCRRRHHHVAPCHLWKKPHLPTTTPLISISNNNNKCPLPSLAHTRPTPTTTPTCHTVPCLLL